MRMLIWLACMPLFSIAQNDWEQLMQPSSILQHKVFQSNPFIYHTAVGGLAFSDSSSVGISVENKYLITSLSKLNISAQFKTLHGGLSIHMNTMANEIFSGVSMGMGYGIRLSKTLGIGVDGKVKRDQFRGFVPFFILSPQLGLLYLFAKKGSISVHLRKLIKPNVHPFYKEFGNISSCINYQIAEQVELGVEITNDFRNKSNLNVYTEWSPTNQLQTYLYYRTNSTEIQTGIVYSLKRLGMGMGISNHPFLGSSAFIMLHHGF